MIDTISTFLNTFGEVLSIIVTVGIFAVGYHLQRRARIIQKLMTWNQY